MKTIEKRLENLESVKDRRPYYPFVIYRYGAKRVPAKPYYIGPNGELPPFAIVHEAEGSHE